MTKEIVVVAVSPQTHSQYAFDWFLKHICKESHSIVLVTCVPSPLESEYFATLGTFAVPPMIYTPEHLEAMRANLLIEGGDLLKAYAAQLRDKFVSCTPTLLAFASLQLLLTTSLRLETRVMASWMSLTK